MVTIWARKTTADLIAARWIAAGWAGDALLQTHVLLGGEMVRFESGARVEL